MNLGSDDQIVDKIFQLSQIEKSVINHQLKAVGLNPIQARALNYIAQHPNTMQKTVSEHLGKLGATTTNIMKVLQQDGLITRTRPQSNERQKLLSLTPAGEATAEAVRQIFVEMENRIRVGLPEAEQTQLMALLNKVQARLTDTPNA